ncbi:MAG: hypothetical protein RSE00_01970 [Clostridia bacterium]
MKEMKKDLMVKLFLALGFIFTLLFFAWATVRVIKIADFNMNCVSYIHRTGSATDTETAKIELKKALDYAEAKGLTEGTVSVFIQNPQNDIGFWYGTLSSTYKELDSMSKNRTVTAIEESNYLMRLRERFHEVVVPVGITIYPYNIIYFAWVMESLIGASVCYLLAYAYNNGENK